LISSHAACQENRARERIGWSQKSVARSHLRPATGDCPIRPARFSGSIMRANIGCS